MKGLLTSVFLLAASNAAFGVSEIDVFCEKGDLQIFVKLYPQMGRFRAMVKNKTNILAEADMRLPRHYRNVSGEVRVRRSIDSQMMHVAYDTLSVDAWMEVDEANGRRRNVPVELKMGLRKMIGGTKYSLEQFELITANKTYKESERGLTCTVSN